MSIFSWFSERKSAAVANPMDVLRELLGRSNSKTGAVVNWKTAAEVSAVFACARVISEGLAQVPFKLYRETADGGKVVAKEHPLSKLLSRKPNDWQTSFEFRETLGLHLALAGNAYVWINRVGNRVVELLPYTPNQVVVKRSDWDLSYEVITFNGQRIPIPAGDMWHLRGPSWDGVIGLEAVKLAREAIGLALATEEHGARMFSNGARVGGILSTEGTLKPEQVKELRESWEKTQGGVMNAFKTAILWGGLKWNPMAMPNDQAQLIEQRRFQVEEICRHFRVMPIMVGYYDKAATYASSEQMFLAHVVHTLGPWYARVEQSADANLLTEKDLDQGYYSKFISAGLMRGAHKDRAEFYRAMYGIGALNPNEIRALEDMNPYDGGEKYRVPLNMTDPNAIPLDNGKGASNATP